MNTPNTEALKIELAGFLQCAPTAALAAAARGELDIQALVKAELQSRGLDAQGRWIGFPAANKLWGQKLALTAV
jgi:hypothetical protein